MPRSGPAPDAAWHWRLEQHESLPSTSDYCIARAEAGEPAGLAVLAHRQTKPRGSRGRSWLEPPHGNLALSILLRPDGALDRPAFWPFLAGLALHEALSIGAGGALSLKWPNDLMLGHRKLAGILVERGTGGGCDWLVIGFGANLAAAPELPDRPVACLAELGLSPSPEIVARRLLAALDDWRAVWRADDFDAIRDAWLTRAHPPGTRLAARIDGAQRTGCFAGLDWDGALLLALDGQERRVDTGEILMLDGS